MRGGGQYSRRRIINGVEVQTRCQLNSTGIIPENFLARIMHPGGEIYLEFTACYYWQVFNAVRKMWPTIMQMKNKA